MSGIVDWIAAAAEVVGSSGFGRIRGQGGESQNTFTTGCTEVHREVKIPPAVSDCRDASTTLSMTRLFWYRGTFSAENAAGLQLCCSMHVIFIWYFRIRVRALVCG